MCVSNFTEIPGPTRKSPPKQHITSDTNEIVGKGSSNFKNQLTTLKETQPTNNNFHIEDYEENNFSSSEDEDDIDIGEA